MPTRSDEDLLLAAGRGNHAAFSLLVERHQRAVVGYVHRFLGTADGATVEDLAQQVFVGAWRYAPTFRPRAKVLTWLFRIATNVCLNYRRYLRVRPATAGLESADPPTASDDGVEAAERASQVRDAVATLAPQQRAAVVLRHFHGFSYQEIAEILDTSASAVDALLQRTRSSLRKKLEQLNPEDFSQDSAPGRSKPQ